MGSCAARPAALSPPAACLPGGCTVDDKASEQENKNKSSEGAERERELEGGASEGRAAAVAVILTICHPVSA